MRKLSLERLEGRVVPATVVKTGMTVNVSAQVGPLLVESVPAGLHVQDSATNQVVAGPYNKVNVTDTVGSDRITVQGTVVPLVASLTVNAGRNPTGPGDTDEVSFKGVGIGNHDYNGSYGSLMVLYELADITVCGNVTFHGATGYDFVSFQSGPSNRIAIYGDVRVNAGANAVATNMTVIGQPDPSLPQGVRISGKVDYDGGHGVDVVQLHDVRLNKVSVKLKDNPANVFIDSPTVYYKKLTVTGDGTIVILGNT